MPKNRIQVLVAEDYFINQELIKEMLDRMNCEVDTVENGQEAVNQFGQKEYDLVFMDIQMPEMDGLEAARQIRQKEGDSGEKKTPIIALTANALMGDREKCLDAGMDDYVSKPFQIQDLETVVKKWIGE